MRQSFLAAALSLMLLVQPLTTIQAGTFATEWTQLLNHGELVAQYIRQGQQLAEAFKHTADMVRNSKNVTSQIFGSVMSDINQLASVVQGGMALAYSMANLDGQFRARFRGYAYNARTYYTDYRDWSQTTLDTIRGTLRAAGLQGQQLQNEQTVLAGLRNMAQSSTGRMEALQVANQIAEQQVQQMMKLRELMLADLQSKQTYQAQQVQKDAAREASVERFLNYTRDASSGNRYQAGWK
jgi:P-type conjugative transfer protein TrbJ